MILAIALALIAACLLSLESLGHEGERGRALP